MKTAALIFGLLAGLLGGLVLAFGTIQANLAALPAFGSNGMLIARLLVYLVPAMGWIGTGIVLARPRFGALCLLLSAAAWGGLAFAAGHGAVLFAAPPFTFAAAAGIVALFARRTAEPETRRDVAPPTAAGVNRSPEPAPLQERRQASPLPATLQSEPEEHFAGRSIPPPFLDDIPIEETPTETLPDQDATAPIVAAMAIQASAIPPEGETQEVASPAKPAAAIVPSPPALTADPNVAGLRTRRPGEWSLPTPADSAVPRYAAERQAPPASPIVSAPLQAEAPSSPVPLSPSSIAAQPTLPPRPVAPSPAQIPAPTEPAVPSATLDFAPADGYGRGGPSAEPRRSAEAALTQLRGRQRAARAMEDTEDETDSTVPDPSDRRAGGLRRLLRSAIAAVFVLALLGVCGAAYLDYLRGPKSILFGQRVHEAGQSEAAPPAAPATKKMAVVASQPPTPAVTATKPVAAPTPSATAAIAPTTVAAAAPTPRATATASASAAGANTGAGAATSPASFSDPVRYCATVRTIDAPDSRYAGPPVPPAVATALLLPKTTRVTQVHWRCADGVALACNANNADACGPTPTVDFMLKYCAAHPGAASMPAPNGSWSCNGKRPVIPDDQSWPVDGHGFYPDAWVRVHPSAPADDGSGTRFLTGGPCKEAPERLYPPKPRPSPREAAMPDIETKPRITSKPSTTVKPARPPLHKVILVNDDFTPRDFVVMILKAEFRMPEAQALKVMLTAHQKGSCVVAVFTREVAESKATRATEMARSKGYPLLFTTEPEN